MMSRPSRIVDDPTVADRIRTHVRRAQDARVGGSLGPQLARLLVAIREEPAPGPSTHRRWLASGIAISGVACVLFGLVSIVSSGGRSEAADEPPRVAAPAAPPELAAPASAPSEDEKPSPEVAPQERALDTRSVDDLPSVRRRPVQSKGGGSIMLEDEIAQLAEVRTLSESDPARALAAAEAGHRRFRSGVLYQEREAIAIDSLKRLHRFEEARRRAQRFTQSYPDSPFAKRVSAGVDDL